ncbi:MAG: hypothetical protein R3E44_03850 [Paracoccaceae bacterium]
MPRPMFHIARLHAELRPSARRHKTALVNLRDASARRETSLDLRPRRLVFDRSDWVSAWIDPRQIVLSWDGTTEAVRGVTTHGRLLWIVRQTGLSRAYHSRAADPFDAMAEARTAWQRRRDQRHLKPEVERIVRDLRWFRRRLAIRTDDAYRSPLCDEGVDGFLMSLGIVGFRTYPGWLIAWLYAFERQVGFVLYEAHRRQLAESGEAAA